MPDTAPVTVPGGSNNSLLQNAFIEVGHFQLCKYNQNAPGDVFLSQKNPSDGRVITTLSDGLGSGIKAGVLAALTATMATKFIAYNIPIRRVSEIIMDTLPVCSERGISYATFTLVDIAPDASVKIMEYDNPPYTFIRGEAVVEPSKEATAFERRDKSTGPKNETRVLYSRLDAAVGDRLIFFSDGVSQAGMGTKHFPFGWTTAKAREFAVGSVREKPEISARELARAIVRQASQIDMSKPKDDISCGVIYFRRPRDMLVVTGPPIRPESDREIVNIFSSFAGKKVVSGGTTATIIGRELNRAIKVNMKSFVKNVPPWSEMEGADMVTEGIITLGAVQSMLEKRQEIGTITGGTDAASRMVDLFLDSDRITFVVGTKINEAHQDPTMPVELEIRRNVIKRIASLLKEKYLKEVQIRYF
ncbi:hypothetical protein R80B4_00796 [Fibrobacteres bacterium R8-0-B4]